jgi:multidrug efflux pump subunit AcrA (membrane-fusion protein)
MLIDVILQEKEAKLASVEAATRAADDQLVSKARQLEAVKAGMATAEANLQSARALLRHDQDRALDFQTGRAVGQVQAAASSAGIGDFGFPLEGISGVYSANKGI